MKTIFKFSIVCVALVMLAILPVKAGVAQGSSCLNPIPITKDFSIQITEPGSYWFSATTYDLPLQVLYIPDNYTGEKMTAYVDFTCTTGVYEDPNLNELTDAAEGWGYTMPLDFTAKDVLVGTQKAYEVIVNESYREAMREFNILYNVEAKVEVYIPQAGTVMLARDTVFRDCAENSDWIDLPDTLEISGLTADNSYVLPIANWVKDSVRVQWLGTKAPVAMVVGKSCDISTIDSSDEDILTTFTLDPTVDNGILDFSSANLLSMIKQYGEGGLYYAKFISDENAQLVFDYKPMSPEMARAIRMNMNEPAVVKANDVEQYYYFSKEWEKQSVYFQSTKKDTIIAYFGATPTFTLEKDDKNYLGSYTFFPEAGKATLHLAKKELAALATSCKTDFIFVRFEVPVATSILPQVWDASPCIDNSTEILPNGTISLKANQSSAIFRMDYQKWEKGDVNIAWSGTNTVNIYLGDTCSFALSVKDEHVIHTSTLKAKKNYTLSFEEIQAMKAHVDADGYLYFSFNSRVKGNITTTQTIDSAYIEPEVPVDPDLPAVPTTECSLSSLPLAQGDQVVLNLDSAFTVYRIDYKAWLKSGATLAWNGAEALHTFVAETCTFALAPYNRYVLAYIPVPAQGNIVLDANQLAAMEEYVSEDGFLYIRFLTKEEGVLEVK